MNLPKIFQGGMGVAISDWRLAQAVSRAGQLGIVSGTGVACALIGRLMHGDAGGDVRRALAAFPLSEPAARIVLEYYTPGGIEPGAPYARPAAYTMQPSHALDQLTAIANFVEVFLAKAGHSGPVGINLLEKVQMPNLASLYGAMLAGVDVVVMGAGIPVQVAGILDRLARHEPVSYRLDVIGAEAGDDHRIHFDPERVFPGMARRVGQLARPRFLPIISSVVLAQALLKRSDGEIDGFVIEAPIAGGHNAPPRGPLQLNERGEPIYGAKDAVDLEKIKPLGRPFWLAGGYGHPEKLQDALAAGAAGVQVGTAFALCEESGMDAALRKRLLRRVLDGAVQVFTSPRVSPTGFPFKVAGLEHTLSDEDEYAARRRVCDLGFLRRLFTRADGLVGYRCPAERVDDYVRKGGDADETVGRGCLCNNLVATAGFPQRRKDGYIEPALITLGDDLEPIRRLMRAGQGSYRAADVIAYLLEKCPIDRSLPAGV
jgi:nitronate monooxygenase